MTLPWIAGPQVVMPAPNSAPPGVLSHHLSKPFGPECQPQSWQSGLPLDMVCQSLTSHWVAVQTLAMPWVGQLCPWSPPSMHSHCPVHLATSQDDCGFCPQIAELETEKRDLERQVNEQKAKCEATEKRESERRQVEEKKHNEEIQFLKRTNQQLKVTDQQAQWAHPSLPPTLPAKQAKPSVPCPVMTFSSCPVPCQGVKEVDLGVRDHQPDSLSICLQRGLHSQL